MLMKLQKGALFDLTPFIKNVNTIKDNCSTE